MSKALDLVKGLLAPEPRPIVSDGDDLTKAGKYRSRKRAMVGGKMRWVYDYGDEKEQGESSKDSHVGTTTSGKKIPASHKGKTFSEAHAGYSGEDHYEAADAHDDAYDAAKAKGEREKAFHHKIMGQAHFQAWVNKDRKTPAGATADSIAAISHEHGGRGLDPSREASGLPRAKKSESDAPTLAKSDKSFTFGSCTYVERDPYTLPEGGGVRRPGLDPAQRAQPPVIDDGRDPYVGELRRLSGQLVRPDHGILHRLKHGLDGSDEG